MNPPTEEPFNPIQVDNGNPQKWWVLIAVGAGTFMSALDASVANIVLPILNRTFHSDVALVEWVVIIYLLVVSGLLLSFGRLGDLRGHRNVYLLGFLIFITSSAFCGLSPSVPVLIACRALQAIGAAMLSANSPAILTKSFPARQRGQALGLQATMTYLGLTVGPSLGGWLTDQFSWRAVFFINVPVGLIALGLSWWAVPHDSPLEHPEPFDLPGAALFMVGLILLLLGLNQGGTWGWLSPFTWIVLAAAGILLAMFIRHELAISHPMLDLSLFRNRLFSASTTSAVLNYICVYAILFLTPFYLLQGRGLSAAMAGLVLTSMPIVMAIVAPISGTLSDHMGGWILGMLGMLILAAGLLLMSRLEPDSPLSLAIVALGVTGFGIGTFISPNNNLLMGAAPRQRQGIAAGVLATARSVGQVLGIGLAGAIFTTLTPGHIGEPGAALFSAIRAGFLITAAIAFAGMWVTAVRGNGQNT